MAAFRSSSGLTSQGYECLPMLRAAFKAAVAAVAVATASWAEGADADDAALEAEVTAACVAWINSILLYHVAIHLPILSGPSSRMHMTWIWTKSCAFFSSAVSTHVNALLNHPSIAVA